MNVSLIVLNDPEPNTAASKLQKIVQAFHSMDAQNKPPLYTLTCPLSEAWGIHAVRLEELSSSIDRNSDAIQVTLKLSEENTTQRLIAQRTPLPAREEETQATQSTDIPDNELSVQQRRTLHERLGRTS